MLLEVGDLVATKNGSPSGDAVFLGYEPNTNFDFCCVTWERKQDDKPLKIMFMPSEELVLKDTFTEEEKTDIVNLLYCDCELALFNPQTGETEELMYENALNFKVLVAKRAAIRLLEN